MLSVLNAGNWAEQFETISERAFLSITMTLVGITIVVLILVILAVVVSLMSRLINGKDEKPALAAAPAGAQADQTASTEAVTADTGSVEADQAHIAAITAAIATIMADSGQPSAGFKIRRIRRV